MIDPPTDAALPYPGARCEETSMIASPPLPCDAPAKFVIKNKDPISYAMCAACADHNVNNRGARYVIKSEFVQNTNADADLDIEPAPAPRDQDLGRIADLAQRQREAEDDVARCTTALAAALVTYRLIAERELPEAMAAVGMAEFKLIDGAKVGIDNRFVGGKLVDPVGLDWVEANGGAALVKTIITLELPTEEVGTAREILDLLRAHPKANRFVKLDLLRSVHNSTIGAFARELVEGGKAPPLDLLGVVRRTIAKIGGRSWRPVELKGFEKR